MVYQPRRSRSIDAELSSSYWTWRANPALTVPSMFSTSLSVLVESIVGLAVLGLIVDLEKTDWLVRIAKAVSSMDYAQLGELLRSPGFVFVALAFLAPAVFVAIVVEVLASGFVYSAEFGSYWLALQGSHVGVAEVMDKFTERWREMAWTHFLSYLVTLAPVLVACAVGMSAVAAGGGLAEGLVAVVLVVIGLAGTLLLSSMLIFTPVVVMAEGLSGRAAVSRSLGLGRRNLGSAFVYGLVYVVLTGGVTFVSSLFQGAGLPLSSLASVGILILVTPVLHLTKTNIYRDSLAEGSAARELLPSFFSDVGPLAAMLWGKFLKGLGELKAFVADVRNLPYHLLSSASMLMGWFAGVYLAQNGVTQLLVSIGMVTGKINPVVSGDLPLTLGISIFFHNWQVSLATALSGVWFSVAPFVTLFLNGTVIGAVSGLAPTPAMFAAAILPHGVIEIPSLVLAGSAGMKLGVSFLRFVKGGPQEADQFHVAARQTVYIAVGLALLFLVAGFIEGNITPVIMRMAGWT
ncbi:MAG TPA: stage II sporulation protein M [Conexivisphaerales archaeon]|nr:stage II sporulation protein M [Conexivisphaerales archaeon]